MVESDYADVYDDAPFCQRVARYLDGQLSPEGLAHLNDELLGDPAKQVVFIRNCMVSAALVREGAADRVAGELLAGDGEGVGPRPFAAGQPPAAGPGYAVQPMDETMILPALREEDDRSDPDPPGEWFPAGPNRGPADGLSDRRRWWHRRRWVAAAAVAVAASLAIWAARPGPPPAAGPGRLAASTAASPTPPAVAVAGRPAAVVTAVAGLGVPEPGTRFGNGDVLVLTAGAVELRFDRGATVVVRGPAHVRIDDGNALALESGAVCAHVPPAAVGFTVTAPGLRVLDHGTNFGVRTATGDAAAEVDVFDGLVDATGLAGDGSPVGDPTPVTAGHAAAHARAAADVGVVAVPFSAAGFDRNIDRIRLPVVAHGTGSGVAAGSPDPFWQIAAVSGDPSWTARPAAVVLDPRPEYAPNSAAAAWVSTTARMGDAAAAKYTYRTNVDLTGFDPTSIAVTAAVAADDGVADVVVNGKSVLPTAAARRIGEKEWRVASHDVPLTDVAWRAGPNRVDVIVVNATSVGWPNYTGLRLGWTVTAALAVRR